MRWVICLISLIAFATQQVLCCCSEAVTFQQNHSTATASAAAASQQHIGCCNHSQEKDTSRHSPANSDGDQDELPHQHHLCVGTHLFYRTVDLTVAPDPLLTGSTSAIADLLPPQLHELHFLHTNHGLPDITHPPRAVLGVFLL